MKKWLVGVRKMRQVEINLRKNWLNKKTLKKRTCDMSEDHVL